MTFDSLTKKQQNLQKQLEKATMPAVVNFLKKELRLTEIDLMAFDDEFMKKAARAEQAYERNH